jgi:hypothetical protein
VIKGIFDDAGPALARADARGLKQKIKGVFEGGLLREEKIGIGVLPSRPFPSLVSQSRDGSKSVREWT